MIYTLTCITAANGAAPFPLGSPIIHESIMVIGTSVEDVIEKLELKNNLYNYFCFRQC